MNRKIIERKLKEEERKMATVSMPHMVVAYEDREDFERKSAESEAQLKVLLSTQNKRGKVLLELLEKGSTTVVMSKGTDDKR